MNSLRHAATVILLREQGDEVQVLLTQRHARLSFMGGMWVFPGGAVGEMDDDAGAATEGAVEQLAGRLVTLHGERLDRRQIRALAVAACRETFEETGLLLARKADGAPWDADVALRLQAQRATVAARPAGFAALLLSEGLQLEIGRLIYWAHWITPSSFPRRFDTRFFAIAAPGSQTASPDLSEASDLAWMSPARWLAAARAGEVPISHPTLYNLEDLDAGIRHHGSLRALLANEAARSVTPILPKLVPDGAEATVVMPWDPDYENTAGEGAPSKQEYQPVMRRLPSRTQLDGRGIPVTGIRGPVNRPPE